MTIKELLYIKKILLRANPMDEHIAKALAYIKKDLAQYEARKGQLRDQYEFDTNNW